MGQLCVERLEEETISCPYCGESIDILIDSEELEQECIEDCQVCCRPITLVLRADFSGEFFVSVYDENDASSVY